MIKTKVICRQVTQCEDGRTILDDTPATIEEADRLAGRRLDRRMRYMILDNEVRVLIHWTGGCSGCRSDYDGSQLGCDECGYTGKRRQFWYAPLDKSVAEPPAPAERKS